MFVQGLTVAFPLQDIAFLLRVGELVFLVPAASVLRLEAVRDVASFFFVPVVVGGGGVGFARVRVMVFVGSAGLVGGG